MGRFLASASTPVQFFKGFVAVELFGHLGQKSLLNFRVYGCRVLGNWGFWFRILGFRVWEICESMGSAFRVFFRVLSH